jgi:hypothetical protein
MILKWILKKYDNEGVEWLHLSHGRVQWEAVMNTVMKCKSCFLDFVHRLCFNEIAMFRKLDLLLSSGRKEGQNPDLSPGLRLAQPGGPTASVLPLYLKTEEDPVSET